MFERYTEKARRVVFFARYEASQFGSPYIETEHLLLGLIREDKALAYRFIREQVSSKSIREEIESHTGIREATSTSVDLPLSDESKRVLAYAAEEAERLGHKHIGTEHLLLGLLREEKSFAAEILLQRGLRLGVLREEMAVPVEPTRPGWVESTRPQIEMVNAAGKLVSRMAWGPWVAIPSAGEFVTLKLGDRTEKYHVGKVTYHYSSADQEPSRLERVEIVLREVAAESGKDPG